MYSLSDKKLLILGAGRGQVGLYKAAKEMGIRTIAGTMPDNSPLCIPMADEVCFMNISDPDEVVEKTGILQFDGVATCCLDKGLKALGRLCTLRGLPGLSEQSSDICNNKLLMKRKFVESGVNTAPFREVRNEDELREAIVSLGGFPLMVKASDLAGSKGIYRVENNSDGLICFRKAMTETRRDFVIVERCIVGKEFGAQAFIQNGRIYFILPHGDILFHGMTDVPVGHYVPLEITPQLLDKIKKESEKAIRAVGLDNCAVNIDCIDEKDNVYVLELSGRIGANGLPEIVSVHYGIDYYKMVILASLGIPVDTFWKLRKQGKAALSRMVISENKSGVLRSLRYRENPLLAEYIHDMQLFAKIGTVVHKFENSGHCIGQFTIEADSTSQCETIARGVMANIEVKIE